MRTKKFLSSIAMVGAASLALAACSGGGGGDDGGSSSSDGGSTGGGDSINLVLGHAGSDTDPRQWGAEQFKATIEEQSEGRITVEIHSNATLGTWEQMVEGLQVGSPDIVIESLLALEAYTDLASVETAPFLYSNDEQFFEVWRGDLGDEITSAITQASGFAPLGAMYRGARNLTTNGAVTSLADLEGKTIRTPSAPTMVQTWENLGARAEALPFDEVYSALEQGVIDGQENPLALIEANAFYEVQTDLTRTQHMFANYHFIMWDDSLSGYSQEDQDLIRSVADEVSVAYSDRTVAELEANATLLQEQGMTFHELTDRDAWVSSVQPVIDGLPDQVKTWVDQIRGM